MYVDTINPFILHESASLKSLRVGWIRSSNSLYNCTRIGDFIISRVWEAIWRASLLRGSSLNQIPSLTARLMTAFNWFLFNVLLGIEFDLLKSLFKLYGINATINGCFR